MSRYTLELRQIIESDNMELFDFDYNFFDDNLKKDFERLFINYFYFREIGQETIARFKKELQTKLNLINHYYKEYYKSVKTVETENFMITKNATDTFTRILEGEQVANGVSDTTSNTTGNNKSFNKFYDTPRNRTNINDAIITNATVDENNGTGTTNQKSKNNATQNNRTIETTILNSKGNIGVAPSGYMIESWRGVISNIYQMIFDECEELFFQLF